MERTRLRLILDRSRVPALPQFRVTGVGSHGIRKHGDRRLTSKRATIFWVLFAASTFACEERNQHEERDYRSNRDRRTSAAAFFSERFRARCIFICSPCSL